MCWMASGLGGSEERPPSSSSSPLLLEEELLRSRGVRGIGEGGVMGETGAGRGSVLVQNGVVVQVRAELWFWVGSSAFGKLSGTKAKSKEEIRSRGFLPKLDPNLIKYKSFSFLGSCYSLHSSQA